MFLVFEEHEDLFEGGQCTETVFTYHVVNLNRVFWITPGHEHGTDRLVTDRETMYGECKATCASFAEAMNLANELKDKE